MNHLYRLISYLEFFKLAKAAGINTCIDTSGACFTREEPFFSKFEELMKYTDLLMVDIKEINDERHIEYYREHIKALKDAVIIDGVDLMGYTTWGCIDFIKCFILSNVKKIWIYLCRFR